MFGRATITLGIGPHSSCYSYEHIKRYPSLCKIHRSAALQSFAVCFQLRIFAANHFVCRPYNVYARCMHAAKNCHDKHGIFASDLIF